MKNADKILAICAIIVSACALAVSIYQTRILSQEKDASVWPYLRISQSWGQDYFIVSISNDGIGPAIIQDMFYEFHDSTFYRIQNLVRFVIKEDGRIDRLPLAYSNIEVAGTAIKAGESKEIMKITEMEGISEILLDHIEQIDLTIEYCSIYKNCWRNRNNDIIEL